MKYNTIMGILVFLFLLNSCNPDFNNVKQKKDINEKTAPKKEGHDKEIKNELISNLRNLIEISNADREKYVKKIEEEPKNQYGMGVFGMLGWVDAPELISSNSKRSIEFRKHVYVILNDIDTNDLGEFSKILILSGQGEILNIFSRLGEFLDSAIVNLYSKKETLDKLDISDLEKIKNYFEELWSIKTVFSKMLSKLVLDYKNDNDLIKTDTGKLKSYASAILNQIKGKEITAEKLRNRINKIISI
ncbi:CRASP family complement regulator-acquiring lipoprotein [Borreliella turdi]|uniref:CRASP family complement regulator-acquiring lipoprotein n=1 Tax=Borreliella turdi TaxID=57863 RepID=UPI001247E257|nr:CRASP family complement regulator-acquiring lipoprotein [Borreliella turdi]